MPDRFRIDIRLLRQLTKGHPSWEPQQSRLAWRDNRLVGFALARSRHLDAIAVCPEFRRQGLGRTLLEDLELLRFGGGQAHFLPGVPQGWREAESFLQATGFRPDWWAEDLHLSVGPREAVFTCCTPGDAEAVVGMVSEEFSERWTTDTALRFQHGDHADVLILRDESGPVAFCHTWHYQSSLLGPSTFWLRNSCPRYGGIGPVGVRAKARGRGLGGRIVVEALNYLAHRGATEVVVDWTAIGKFYEKYGFKTWQRYRGYSKNE